jgi:hypothetical protein
MVSKKKDNSWMDDGDSAHWVKSKSKRKRVTPSDLNSSAKYTGKGKTTRKKVSGK